jgi:hypothetical protein
MVSTWGYVDTSERAMGQRVTCSPDQLPKNRTKVSVLQAGLRSTAGWRTSLPATM